MAVFGLIAVASMSLAACASDHIVVERGSVFGVGATGKPSGAAVAAVGGFTEAAAAIPYVNKKTGQQYAVPGPCGGFDAPSVSANVDAKAGSGGAIATTMSLGITDQLEVGEPAKLAKLAAIQAAAPNQQILSQYRDCRNSQPGSSVQGSGASTFNSAPPSPPSTPSAPGQ
jgi:hypothetical protein